MITIMKPTIKEGSLGIEMSCGVGATTTPSMRVDGLDGRGGRGVSCLLFVCDVPCGLDPGEPENAIWWFNLSIFD